MSELGTLLTPSEAAQYLKVHRRTLYTYLNSGELRATKIRRSWRIDRADLQSFRLGQSPERRR